MKTNQPSRRKFIGTSAILTAGALMIPGIGSAKPESKSTPEDLYQIGPKEGFTPHVGTMLSMMTMMREWVIRGVKDLSVEQLDFQLDDKSNSIGAMLYHLAATEKYYQLNTFDNMPWGEWDQSIKDEWDVAMSLGENARETIKGNEVSFYLEKLSTVRNYTIEKFKELDDEWLMTSEPFFPLEKGKPGETNNYAKWFHVCEHESNHNGQIKFIRSRLPK